MSAALLALLVQQGCKPAATSMAGLPAAIPSSTEETQRAIRDAGGRLTLVHLWATWCAPCREEFPELIQAYRDLKDLGLSLVLVSADESSDIEAVEKFLKEHDAPVGSLVAEELDERFIELFSTNWSGALPASFFYDTEGNLVAEWDGSRSYDEYVETVESLLK